MKYVLTLMSSIVRVSLCLITQSRSHKREHFQWRGGKKRWGVKSSVSELFNVGRKERNMHNTSQVPCELGNMKLCVCVCVCGFHIYLCSSGLAARCHVLLSVLNKTRRVRNSPRFWSRDAKNSALLLRKLPRKILAEWFDSNGGKH